MSTLKEIKKKSVRKLINCNIDNSNYEVLNIISHVLKIKDIDIITENNFSLNINQEKKINRFICERISGKPLAYITNKKKFYNEIFFINESVLIPRHETEEVLSIFFSETKSSSMIEKSILDIGSGSGIISILCKKKYPESKVYGIDKSNDAIKVAKRNSKEKNLKVKYMTTEIKKCKLEKIDFVISNPPYIKSSNIANLSEDVKNEPLIALDGGQSGLEIINDIFVWEKNINQNNASMILIEIDGNIAKEAEKLAKVFYGSRNIETLKDISNKYRILKII